MYGPPAFCQSTPFYLAMVLSLSGCGKDKPASVQEGVVTAPIPTNPSVPVASGSASVSNAPTSSKVVANPPPSAEAATNSPHWDTAKEVLVRGSSAVSCETKILGSSFRMVCRPNENTGKVISANPVRGFDATKGELTIQSGALTLICPYERGTDVIVTILWERSFGRFMLAWPMTKTELPQVPGQIVVQDLTEAATQPPKQVQVEESPPETTKKDLLFVIFDERKKYGYIDASGQIVIPTEFDDTALFQEGFAAIRQDKRWGYVDRFGKVVITPQWVSAGAFSEGYAQVTLQERLLGAAVDAIEAGYIDRTGKYAIKPIWRGCAEEFQSGLALICPEKPAFEKNGYGIRPPSFIKPDGSNAFPQHRLVHAFPYSDSMAFATIFPEDTKTERMVFLDTTGAELALPAGFGYAQGFSEGVAVVQHSDLGTWGILGKGGKLSVIKDAEEIDEFSEGLAVVSVRGKYGYIKADGSWAIKPKYLCAQRFSDGVARVCEGSLSDERYINAAGRIVIANGRGMPAFIHWGRVAGHYEGGLQFRKLTGEMKAHSECSPDHRDDLDPKASYGYRNKAGKYVWVSPGAEAFLPEQFWKDEYVGPPRKTMTAPKGASSAGP